MTLMGIKQEINTHRLQDLQTFLVSCLFKKPRGIKSTSYFFISELYYELSAPSIIAIPSGCSSRQENYNTSTRVHT